MATRLLILVVLLSGFTPSLYADDPKLSLDSDHDGLSDVLEQQLLVQFSPHFLIARHDCAGTPAEFRAGANRPDPEAENGSIYGQVTPANSSPDGRATAEIHYYHLWDRDCGPNGHLLDTEHVSALVEAPADAGGQWKALAWYAAAHENTVCDVSQVARASALQAEDHGATVWISPGKHASYLSEAMCAQGCGADHCEALVPLETTQLINLGEPGHPMNGATFVDAPEWPLLAKMIASNFSANTLTQLPADGVVWANSGPHPAQGVIASGYNTGHALAISGENTSGALTDANDSTGSALGTSAGKTGNALGTSAQKTGSALGKAAHSVGRALALKPREKKQE